jgi:DNA-binding helix-hairpin-helix protein with protein kinase domain
MITTGEAPIELGPEVGKGGEAIIHEVVGRPDLLAKIYIHQARTGYDQKLGWMLASPPTDPSRALGHASIAWPVDLLYTKQHDLVGYLMPYIRDAVSLLEVFNPRLRARKLPGFDLRYLYRTAYNLAIVVSEIHKQQYVIGDINESNLLVTPSAMVTIIDTDSFQVKEPDGAKQVVYPCPVGKPEYTAPELQGRSFQETVQQPEQDCFGLGVLVFQLVMGGSHPFRARWLQPGDPPPIEERIRRGCFAHVDKPRCPVAAPQNIPTLDTVHPKLAGHIRRCFVEGHQHPHLRPTPEQWGLAIAEAENRLIACQHGHYYADHVMACPYCQLQSNRQSKPSRHSVAYRPTQLTSKRLSVPMPSIIQPRPQARRFTSSVKANQPAISCSRCGTKNNLGGDIYCQTCAYQLCGNRWCRFCGKETPILGRYCVHCGTEP